MENAIVTDGCDLSDDSSTITASGGSGGIVYTIQTLATSFSPADLSISTGDTVRWRQVEYYNSTDPHEVLANDSSWGSGSGWNLGSTYSKTFTAEGHTITTVLCTHQCMVPLQ